MATETDTKFPQFSVEETDDFLKEAISGLFIENPADVRTLEIFLAQSEGQLSKHQRTWMHTLMNRDGKRFPLD